MISNVNNKIKLTVNKIHNHPQYIETISDSGCTGHYLKNDKSNSSLPKTIPQIIIIVSIPNGDIMTSKHKTSLQIPALNQETNEAHIFDNLSTANPLFVGKLCDE